MDSEVCARSQLNDASRACMHAKATAKFAFDNLPCMNVLLLQDPSWHACMHLLLTVHWTVMLLLHGIQYPCMLCKQTPLTCLIIAACLAALLLQPSLEQQPSQYGLRKAGRKQGVRGCRPGECCCGYCCFHITSMCCTAAAWYFCAALHSINTMCSTAAV